MPHPSQECPLRTAMQPHNLIERKAPSLLWKGLDFVDSAAASQDSSTEKPHLDLQGAARRAKHKVTHAALRAFFAHAHAAQALHHAGSNLRIRLRHCKGSASVIWSDRLFPAGPKELKVVLHAPSYATACLLRRFIRPAAALVSVSDTPCRPSILGKWHVHDSKF